MELEILKLLLKKDNYDSYRDNIKPSHFNGERRGCSWKVLEQIDGYFKTFNEDLDVNSLKTLHEEACKGNPKLWEKLEEHYSLLDREMPTDTAEALFGILINERNKLKGEYGHE